MRRKLNILLAVIIVMVGLTACQDTVKYIPTDAEEINDASSEMDVAENTSNQTEIMDVETATDCGNWSWESKIPVYVCGAVQNPGVYYMNPTALKEEALQMAGGFTADAAIDYINLAETVVSGEKIYFPYTYELQDGYNMESNQSEQGSGRLVNINTATKDELMTLPGIGESKAEAIIKYRDKNGPFQDAQDITNIPGIKEGVYNNIKEHIVVN